MSAESRKLGTTSINIPLSAPDICESDIDAVVEVLRSGNLSLGPKLPEFEKLMAEQAGRRFGIAMNSGTSALHLAVKSLGLGRGDRVLTSPFSFIASANCLLMEGCEPVFVDVSARDYNLDIEQAARCVEEAERVGRPIRAILGVDVFGRPARWDLLEGLAGEHQLTLIEDSCEALGAELQGRPAGNFGEAAVFAFYPNKQMTTGEGGILVTDSERIAELSSSMRNQGRDEGMGWLSHGRLGYNYRLSDIHCALGIAQIGRLPEFMKKRAAVAAEYHRLLGEVEELLLLPPFPEGRLSWFVYVVRLGDRFSEEDRNRIVHGLRARGIGSNVYFPSIHLQPFYVESFGYGPGDFPVCESVSSRTIALPFFNELQPEQVSVVVESLKALLVA